MIIGDKGIKYHLFCCKKKKTFKFRFNKKFSQRIQFRTNFNKKLKIMSKKFAQSVN